ncbi:MAG: flagellar hook-basal body complex protein [Planctomycetaceae bacterium]
MANSLLTGISGLRGHQSMLEVIGNNLANLNTIGFKSARVMFADLLYEGSRAATSSAGQSAGSVNPLQVGTGSKVANVDRLFSQGNLEQTGERLDVAIEGNGFLVTRSGNNTFYTRSGALGIDEQGFLVDPSNGSFIQRFGIVGETNPTSPSFQVPGDTRIRVPFGAAIPGTPTTQITLTGNLPANSNGPQAQLVTSEALTTGVAQTNADATTLLVDLNPAPWADGDVISFFGRDSDGEPIPQTGNTFTVTATSTLGDLRDAVAAVLPVSTVSIVNGQIRIEANDTGPSTLSFEMVGGTGVKFTQIVEGKDATLITGTLPVYDPQGLERSLSYQLEKQPDESWTLSFSLPDNSDQFLDNVVEGIRFGLDGSLLQVAGTGAGDPNIEVLFAGAQATQAISISFATDDGAVTLSEVGSTSSLNVDIDGFIPGEISDVAISRDGTIEAIGSNSVKFPLAQLAIASFRNNDGLLSAGNNVYRSSLASGSAEIGSALSGDRGAILSRQLEGSNVDLALEFTKLIVAQRGFSANARTITVTDEVLGELTNIIR